MDLIAFFLPGCGLFWMAVGAWIFFSSFRNVSQTEALTEPASETSPTSKTEPDSLLRVRLSGLVWVILGIAVLWFSDIRIGVRPAVISQIQEENSPLSDIVILEVEREFEKQGHIGMVIGAVARDEEFLLGFGKSRLGDSQPPDADTVFEIGSISKVFTGILLAKLVESGELKLDDRIADLLPEGWSLSEPAREVTVQHLTTHTSGFPRLPANLFGITSIFSSLFGGDPYRAYSEESFRESLSTLELESEPGTKRLYSNFAVGLLGFVLATHSELDYESLLKAELCDPLGMTRTTITNDAWQRERFAPGYGATAKMGPAMLALESSPWEIPNHLAGAGAIRSTGKDMLTFLKANMGLISTPLDNAIQRSHQELFEDPANMSMGMNWIRYSDSILSQNILWHNGGTGGYSSYIGFTEDRRFGVVALANTGHSVDELGDRILWALGRKFGEMKPVSKDGYAKAAPFTGVRWESDRPTVLIGARWSKLVSINDIPIDRIMEFAREKFGDIAHKRFSEDLVELLSKMDHDPDWVVTLGLETEDGQVEQVEVTMTEENRDLVRN